MTTSGQVGFLGNLSSGGSEKFYIEKIENFFQEKYNISTSLIPSGRSAIGAVLSYLNINRSDLAFVPKWSSHCIYNTVGAYSSITENFLSNPTIVLSVHKWGQVNTIPTEYDGVVLEDSVDSIHLSEKAFFPSSKSAFELISLPKILGVITGGLVVSKDENFHNYVIEKRSEQNAFTDYQSRLKWRKKEGFASWHSLEFNNYRLSIKDLKNIHVNLNNFNLNRDKILTRINVVRDKFDISLNSEYRVGSVLAFDESLYQFRGPEKTMIRMFNFNKSTG